MGVTACAAAPERQCDPTLLVIPLLTGEGMRLTPAVSQDSRLTLESQQVLHGGVLEVTYSCDP